MAAVATYGTTVSIGGTALTGITDITPPSFSRGTIDITNIASDDHAKEFIPGFADGGEMSVTVIVGAGSGISTISGYMSDYTTAKACSITLATGGSVAFDGWVTKVQFDGLSAGDNAAKATIGIKPTGLVTYSIT